MDLCGSDLAVVLQAPDFGDSKKYVANYYVIGSITSNSGTTYDGSHPPLPMSGGSGGSVSYNNKSSRQIFRQIFAFFKKIQTYN